MKKFLVLVLFVSITTFLVGCSDTIDTVTDLNLDPLNDCIDAMVDEQSNAACDRDTKLSLMDEYANAFVSGFEYEDIVFNHSDLNYSLIRDGSEEIEYWFQFSLLPADDYLTKYEDYKDIMVNMKSELEVINDTPTYILGGEFMFYGDVAYKFNYTQSFGYESDVIVWNMDVEFDTTYTEYETFILEKANDEDFDSIDIIIVTGLHNVEITVDPINDTYSFIIYYSDEDATITDEAVESIITTSFSTISFTLDE